MKLFAIEIFRAHIESIVRMEPFRLLIPSPFVMIEVLYSSRLIESPVCSCILIYGLFSLTKPLIDTVFDVICLSTNWIR